MQNVYYTLSNIVGKEMQIINNQLLCNACSYQHHHQHITSPQHVFGSFRHLFKPNLEFRGTRIYVFWRQHFFVLIPAMWQCGSMGLTNKAPNAPICALPATKLWSGNARAVEGVVHRRMELHPWGCLAVSQIICMFLTDNIRKRLQETFSSCRSEQARRQRVGPANGSPPTRRRPPQHRYWGAQSMVLRPLAPAFVNQNVTYIFVHSRLGFARHPCPSQPRNPQTVVWRRAWTAASASRHLRRSIHV